MPHLTRLVAGSGNFIEGDSKTFVTRRILSCALLLACVLLLSARGVAQVQAGRILGTVVDPTGAAVPEASITVTVGSFAVCSKPRMPAS